MKTYQLDLDLLSPTLAGSGDGFGALIDVDVVLDDVGLPVIPAKRIKGCLLDAAREVQQMLATAGIAAELPLEQVFGKIGGRSSAPVVFSSLTIADYEANRSWLRYLLDPSGEAAMLSRDEIVEIFTEIRHQTRIDEQTGVALKGSLRTSRLLRRDLSFTGAIEVFTPDEATEQVLALACTNLRHLGTRRNRGLGRVRCKLSTAGNTVSVNAIVEDLCTN